MSWEREKRTTTQKHGHVCALCATDICTSICQKGATACGDRDHVLPHMKDVEGTWVWVCAPCHRVKTEAMKDAGQYESDPVDYYFELVAFLLRIGMQNSEYAAFLEGLVDRLTA